MAIKISQLPKKTALSSTDSLPIVDKLGNNYRIDGNSILDIADLEGNSDVLIKNILKSTGAIETSISLNETLSDKIFHRPNNENLPSGRGWLKSVSSVAINGQALLQNQDFIFQIDRQSFYFLKKVTGSLVYSGYAADGENYYEITASKNIVQETNFVSLDIDIASITSVVFVSNPAMNPAPPPVIFNFEKNTNTLFLKTKFSAQGAEAIFTTDSPGSAKVVFTNSFTERDSLDVPADWWTGNINVYLNNNLLSSTLYSLQGKRIIFNNNIQNSSVKITGQTSGGGNPAVDGGDAATIEYKINRFSGNIINLPTYPVSLLKFTLINLNWYGQVVEKYSPYFSFDTSVFPFFIHLGYDFPGSYASTAAADIIINAVSSDNTSYIFKKEQFSSNIITLPKKFDDIRLLKINNTDEPVVVASNKLFFVQSRNGNISYNANHVAYQGLSNGGETIEIIREIPGITATTAGTGHHSSTFITLYPEWNGSKYYLDNFQKDWVDIYGETDSAVYLDRNDGASKRIKNGYTDEDIKPITSKLPLAALTSMDRISDESLINVSFNVDKEVPFQSSTYLKLDDTKRSSESQMTKGKILQLSSDNYTPVRGVRGININGAEPVYFAGKIQQFMILSMYKWFVVKCISNNNNIKLENGKEYILCVNNVHWNNQSIKCQITNKGFNISADLFPIV